jgi:hypothetical protein
VLAGRFPGLAALLPAHQAAGAFWLAAWWGDGPAAPTWLPSRLLTDPARLAAAAEAISGDLLARSELVDLDARIDRDTVLGRQVATALDLPGRPAAQVAAVVSHEPLPHQLVRRIEACLGPGDLAQSLAGGSARSLNSSAA